MSIGIILPLLLAGQAAAQDAKPVEGGATLARTLQQQFDDAVGLADKGECASAVPPLEALQKNVRLMRNATAKALIEVKLGLCLMSTPRAEEGSASIKRGLAVLTPRSNEFAADVREANMRLGHTALLQFDYGGAASFYRAALNVSQGATRVRPLNALAQALAFDRDGQALGYAAEAKKIAEADANFDKKMRADVQTVYARVLMNEGRHKEAYEELKTALRNQGGLDLNATLAEVSTRSDLAIAAMLNGDVKQAKEYLVYTGAGRMEREPMSSAVSMPPPPCGTETNLKPTDFAVVEFALSEQGATMGVRPVYTTGGRDVAVAFARAVSGWSWTPEAVKALPEFFRWTTRVELRCTVGLDRPKIIGSLTEEYKRWAGPAADAWNEMSSARAAPLQRSAVEAARSRKDQKGELIALAGLGANEVVGTAEGLDAITKAETLASELSAPVAARTYIELTRLGRAWSGKPTSSPVKAYGDGLRAILSKPDVAADPIAASTIALLLVSRGTGGAGRNGDSALLNGVIDNPKLPSQHPLKVAAMLELANVLARKNDLAGAQAVFARTGLTEEQCSYLGLTPAVQRTGMSSNDYPMDALMMGFEGWVKTEFDVAADGRTIAPRVIVAYPPFVFNDATIRMAKGMRYASSFRPAGSVACTAENSRIRFSMRSR